MMKSAVLFKDGGVVGIQADDEGALNANSHGLYLGYEIRVLPTLRHFPAISIDSEEAVLGYALQSYKEKHTSALDKQAEQVVLLRNRYVGLRMKI